MKEESLLQSECGACQDSIMRRSTVSTSVASRTASYKLATPIFWLEVRDSSSNPDRILEAIEALPA